MLTGLVIGFLLGIISEEIFLIYFIKFLKKSGYIKFGMKNNRIKLKNKKHKKNLNDNNKISNEILK